MNSNNVSASDAEASYSENRPVTRPGHTKRELLLPATVGLLLGVVVVGPMIGGGWAWMLDLVGGPHPKFPRTFYGLDGGVVALIPLAAYGLGKLVGTQVASWLPFVLAFPIALTSIYCLLDHHSKIARIGAGLFYALTPVVFDRLWAGHGGFLIGYGLMPCVVASLRLAMDAGGWRWVRVGGWIALVTAASPHYIWISLVFIFGMLVTRRPQRDVFAGTVLAVTIAGLCSAHLLASSQSEGRAFTVDQRDVAAYASRSIGNEPLAVTLATTRGFWRIDNLQPNNNFPGRTILLVLGGTTILIGVATSQRAKRANGLALFVGSVVAVFLASGSQGPTGHLFLWAFNHVPGFAIMREPQKFVVVVALAATVAFGAGLEKLRISGNGRTATVIAALVALVVPASLNPGIYWAYGGRLKAINPPAAWSAADYEIGAGSGSVLSLPWHQYLTFPFIDGRIVTNPADTTFRRNVIEGDNVELPNLPTTWNTASSEYLSFLYDQGNQISTFGALVSTLNIQYIALAKTVNWSDYSWLNRQRDLEVVSDNKDMVVYKNKSWAGTSYSTSNPVSVADWGELVGYSEAHGTVAGVTVDAIGPGTIRLPSSSQSPTVRANAARRLSAVSYKLQPAAPGDLVVTSETYNVGWEAKGRRVAESPQGTVMVPAAQAGESVRFNTWIKHLIAYVIAIVAAMTTIVSCALSGRRLPHRSLRMSSVDD